MGKQEAEYNEDTGKWIIKARAINFVTLVHEIVKGLYEIISMRGYVGSKDGEAISNMVDKVEHEPEDLRYGKYIYDSIMEVFINSEYDDPRIRELLLKGLAEELSDDEFISFMQNASNDSLTPQQIKRANDIMREANDALKRDDAGEDPYDPTELFEQFKRRAGL